MQVASRGKAVSLSANGREVRVWELEELAAYHLVGGLLTLGGVILSERWTTPVRAA